MSSVFNLLFGALPRTTVECDFMDSANTLSFGFIFFNSLIRSEFVEYCSDRTSLPVLSLSAKTISNDVVRACSVLITNLDNRSLDHGH